MPDPRSIRLQQLIAEASLLPTDEAVELFLRERCADDLSLAADVRARLAEPLRESASKRSAASTPPAAIGGYRIVRTLGHGGMGIVYEAEQTNPARTVAVKVLHWEADDDAFRRFEHEAQVLGWLHHPGIAHVYEAGVEGHGPAGARRPFFAMELIDGVPIDRYATDAGLDTEARLRLVMRVAEGLHHAHQKGVIHRDIKPANILVNAAGQPKILDFGVARVAAADGENASTLLTRVGEIVGTLGYMSPEQIHADPSGVDIRADVYSLGVLTYQLLSGKRPFEVKGLPLHEAMRRVIQDDATQLTQIARSVPDDVATIVHKAIEKDKERRYSTVAEFAGDITRFLNREPIEARPPSRTYQIKRFVQRNRAATVGLVATAAALLCGAGVSYALYLRERDTLTDLRDAQSRLAISFDETQDALEVAESERAESAAQLELLQSSNRYFEDLLQAPLPSEAGRDVRLADVLDRIAKEGHTAFGDSSRQRAWLALTLASSFRGLRLFEPALEQVERARGALDELEADGVNLKTERARLAENEGRTLLALGRVEDAQAVIEQGLAVLEGDESRAALNQKHRLHTALTKLFMQTSDFDRALAELDKGTECFDRSADTSAADFPAAVGFRGFVLANAGDVDGAQQALEESLRLHDERGSRRSMEAAQTMATLASVVRYKVGSNEGLRLLEESLEITVELVGEEHIDVALALVALGTNYRGAERLEDAEAHYSRALDIAQRVFPEGDTRLQNILSMRGSLRIAMGQHDAGEKDLVDVIEALSGSENPNDIMVRAFAMSYRAPAMRLRGELDEADELIEKALGLKRSVIGREFHPAYEIDLQERAMGAVTRGDLLLEATRELELAEFFFATLPAGAERIGYAAKRAQAALTEHIEKSGGSTDETDALNARIDALL